MDKGRNGKNGQTLKTVVLKGQETGYVLKRSTRRTIGIRIDREGLKVSAPLRMPEKTIENMLSEKSAWILRKMEELKPPPARQWKEGETIHFLGKPLFLRISFSSKREVRVNGACLEVFLPDLEKIQATIESWYRRQALEFFSSRVAHYCGRLDLALPRLFISNAKTRWGSCNSKREVRLNWRLVSMDPDLVDYVVVHELSHLIEMNHSKSFWNTVESVYPAYDSARRALRLNAQDALW